jgi:hypothetical protein
MFTSCQPGGIPGPLESETKNQSYWGTTNGAVTPDSDDGSGVGRSAPKLALASIAIIIASFLIFISF